MSRFFAGSDSESESSSSEEDVMPTRAAPTRFVSVTFSFSYFRGLVTTIPSLSCRRKTLVKPGETILCYVFEVAACSIKQLFEQTPSCEHTPFFTQGCYVE